MAPRKNMSSTGSLYRMRVRHNTTLKSLGIANRVFRRGVQPHSHGRPEVFTYKLRSNKKIKDLKRKLSHALESAAFALEVCNSSWKLRGPERNLLETYKRRLKSARHDLADEKRKNKGLQKQMVSLQQHKTLIKHLTKEKSVRLAEKNGQIRVLKSDLVEARRPESQVSDGTIIRRMGRMQHEIYDFIDDDITEHAHTWHVEEFQNLLSERARLLLHMGSSKIGAALIQAVIWESIILWLFHPTHVFGMESNGPLRTAQDFLKAIESTGVEKDARYKAWFRRTSALVEKTWPDDLDFAQKQLIEKTKKYIEQVLVQTTNAELTRTQARQLDWIVKEGAAISQILRTQDHNYHFLHRRETGKALSRGFSETELSGTNWVRGAEIDCLFGPLLRKKVNGAKVVIMKGQVLCLGPATTTNECIHASEATGTESSLSSIASTQSDGLYGRQAYGNLRNISRTEVDLTCGEESGVVVQDSDETYED